MLHRHPVLSLVTLAYLAFVGWVTLGPQPLDSANNGWLLRALGFFARHDATDWITYGRVEFAANIGMFIPIGVFLLLLLGRRLWWLAILAGVVLTGSIEFTQQFLPTRYPDLRDLVANSAGAVLGVLFALVITGWEVVRRPPVRGSARV
ncbi:VanZ family protein [Cryobacterium tagatosivorans]|uniref:VanZ family protein n=1 Tax=Cryobacterium tagatosivorans TaxID=1259199 RepID=A0A4R8U9H3_9MICO|nr:VanZ family protein [Cryobacterium tagatosivorans]TFB46282.1 VanZ family protein [Cryobacterium tagatosivorans]